MIFSYLIYYQAVNGQPCQLSHFPSLTEESKVLQLLEHSVALPLQALSGVVLQKAWGQGHWCISQDLA